MPDAPQPISDRLPLRTASLLLARSAAPETDATPKLPAPRSGPRGVGLNPPPHRLP
jgi:hypothetical protein